MKMSPSPKKKFDVAFFMKKTLCLKFFYFSCYFTKKTIRPNEDQAICCCCCFSTVFHPVLY